MGGHLTRGNVSRLLLAGRACGTFWRYCSDRVDGKVRDKRISSFQAVTFLLILAGLSIPAAIQQQRYSPIMKDEGPPASGLVPYRNCRFHVVGGNWHQHCCQPSFQTVSRKRPRDRHRGLDHHRCMRTMAPAGIDLPREFRTIHTWRTAPWLVES